VSVQNTLRHRGFLRVSFRGHWRDHLHDCGPGHHVTAVQGAPRCTWCGHRQPCCGEPPAATRDLPPVLWPFELAGRAEAIVRGHLIRRGKLPQ
jgi:hypothetical protein